MRISEERRKYLRLQAAMAKKWLTQEEAAFYCGVSESQFRAKKNALHLTVHDSDFGKLLFSRAELDKIIEAGAWRDSESASIGSEIVPTSIGPTKEKGTGHHSARYPSRLQKQLDKLRSSS